MVDRGNPPSRSRTPRNQRGSQMVELLVSIGMVSYVMAAALDGLAVVSRSSTATQNHMIATVLAQQIFDHCRHCRFDDVTVGTTALLVNNCGDGATGPPLMSRPLLLDVSSNVYANETFNHTLGLKGNVFAGDRGTAVLTVANNGADRKDLTLVITWPAENGGGAKTLRAVCTLYRYGLNSGHD